MAGPDLRGHGGPEPRRPGGLPGIVGRAVDLIDRYGPELEYDLQAFLGLDLLDFLRGRHPWGKLLRLADQLPRESRYIAALHDDDEIAPLLVAAQNDDGSGEEPRMSLVGWTPERELLTEVLHSVRAMHATLIAANSKSGKPPEVPKPRRPRTLVDDLRVRRDRDEAERVIQLFKPSPDAAGAVS